MEKYITWYWLTDENGRPIKDMSGNYHIMPTKESLITFWGDYAEKHVINEIKQPIKSK